MHACIVLLCPGVTKYICQEVALPLSTSTHRQLCTNIMTQQQHKVTLVRRLCSHSVREDKKVLDPSNTNTHRPTHPETRLPIHNRHIKHCVDSATIYAEWHNITIAQIPAYSLENLERALQYKGPIINSGG